MSTTYNSSEMTSAPAKAIHAGVNAVNISYTTPATVSGTVLINMCKLPAGAEVFKVGLYVPDAAEGDAADKYFVRDGFGTEYIVTAVATAVDDGVENALGFALNRLTSSSHLVVHIEGKAATGTSALNVQLSALYLSEKEGD